ncbi:MAG: Gfo/Idh/MocA family oxidoreductase, partial [Pirellulaceae bacterium]|nr:Gfo/Idh/MocA family oxidoreductase [Pirellulaceae bacterium]
MPENDDYGLSPTKLVHTITPPNVDYGVPKPKSYCPKIGLIGAGGISEFHLKNYRTCGYDVAAIASRTLADAEKRRDEFYPDADVYGDYRQLLSRDDIEVVDVTPHPMDRLPILRDAIVAGKHVLSQKPFVLNLDDGESLMQLARTNNIKLAVNQNGRWAPHFAYMRSAIASGLIGEVTSIDFNLQWDQTWIAGNEAFENVHHLILFDFGVHWFDAANYLMGGQSAQTVYAKATRFDDQVYRPPAIASAVIGYPHAQVRMSFHGHTRLGEEDVTTVV